MNEEIMKLNDMLRKDINDFIKKLNITNDNQISAFKYKYIDSKHYGFCSKTIFTIKSCNTENYYQFTVNYARKKQEYVLNSIEIVRNDVQVTLDLLEISLLRRAIEHGIYMADLEYGGSIGKSETNLYKKLFGEPWLHDICHEYPKIKKRLEQE